MKTGISIFCAKPVFEFSSLTVGTFFLVKIQGRERNENVS